MKLLTTTMDTDELRADGRARYTAELEYRGERFRLTTSVVTDQDGGLWIGGTVYGEGGDVVTTTNLRLLDTTAEGIALEATVMTALWRQAEDVERAATAELDEQYGELAEELAGELEDAFYADLGIPACGAQVAADCTGQGTAYAGRCLPCDLEVAATEERFAALGRAAGYR